MKHKFTIWIIIVIKTFIVHHKYKIEFIVAILLKLDAFVWVEMIIYFTRLVDLVLRTLIKNKNQMKSQEYQEWIY